MNKIIKEFIKSNPSAKQGCEEWLNERKKIIGGSEISVITGHSKFSSLAGLIAEKTGLSQFEGNDATRWGQLFEPVTQILFTRMFTTEVHAAGGIHHQHIPQHKYSPDGICVTKINNKKSITLLEFKSPKSTIPNGKIPPHYIPQIKAGLCTVNIAEYGIFVNNLFRRCALEDLDFSLKYDSTVVHNDGKKFKPKETLAYGVILFYLKKSDIVKIQKYNDEKNKTNENTIKDDDVEIELQNEFIPDEISDEVEIEDNSLLAKLLSDQEPLDLGKSDIYEFNEFLEYCKLHNMISVRYLQPQINTNINLNPPIDLNPLKQTNLNFTKTIMKNKDCIAYLPWKLFKSDIIKVDKESDYLNQYKEKIENTIKIIEKINAAQSKIDAFEQEFSDSDIVTEYRLRNQDGKEFLYDENEFSEENHSSSDASSSSRPSSTSGSSQKSAQSSSNPIDGSTSPQSNSSLSDTD